MTLMAGDIEGALGDHAEGSKDRYRATFGQYTVEQFRSNLSNVVDVKFSSSYGNFVECGIIREEEGGEKYAYPVTFVKDDYGEWKILGY